MFLFLNPASRDASGTVPLVAMPVFTFEASIFDPSRRELTREAYDRMSKNLERDEQIAYVACAKAHATWKAIGMGVATKCLSWINTLNLATRHELEPSPRHA